MALRIGSGSVGHVATTRASSGFVDGDAVVSAPDSAPPEVGIGGIPEEIAGLFDSCWVY